MVADGGRAAYAVRRGIMKSVRSRAGWLRRFVGWLFGAPFRELPGEFGDTVPSELEVFEVRSGRARRYPVAALARVSSGNPPRRSVRR